MPLARVLLLLRDVAQRLRMPHEHLTYSLELGALLAGLPPHELLVSDSGAWLATARAKPEMSVNRAKAAHDPSFKPEATGKHAHDHAVLLMQFRRGGRRG